VEEEVEAEGKVSFQFVTLENSLCVCNAWNPLDLVPIHKDEFAQVAVGGYWRVTRSIKDNGFDPKTHLRKARRRDRKKNTQIHLL
jgi:hypothetical protein